MSDVSIEMTAEDRKIAAAFDKLSRMQDKMEQKFRDVGKEARKTGKTIEDDVGKGGEKAFGSKPQANLKRFATQWVSVGAAVAGVTAALRADVEMQNLALAKTRELADARRRLNQIATSSQDLAGLNKRADELAARHGVTREQARATLFSARSEGFEDTAEFILSANRVLDPSTGATLAGQVPGLFPSHKLSGREAINLGLVAAQTSRLDAEQLTASLPRVAEGANLAGSSPEEALAIASVMASRFSSGKTAADRGKAFGTRVGITPGLSGLGIVGAFSKIRDEFSPEQRQEFLGESQELNTFFQVMTEEFDRVVSLRSKLEGVRATVGTDRSPVMQGIRRAERDPQTIASEAVARSENRLESSRDTAALQAARFDVLRNESLRRLETEGAGVIQRGLFRAGFGLSRALGADPEAAVDIGSLVSTGEASIDPQRQQVGARLSSDVFSADDDVQRAQMRAAIAIERAAVKLERAAGGGNNAALVPTGADR